jgi:hypothetical protein
VAIQDGVIGKALRIERATPLTINLYGTPIDVKTQAKTVAEVLKEKGIKLLPGDNLLPDAQATVAANMTIVVMHQGTKVITTVETIPAPTQYVEDPNLNFGTTVVRQAGVAGKRTSTFQIQTENGQEVSRQLIQTVTEVEPVPQIIARGKAVQIPGDKTALMAAAGIAPSDYPYVDFIISHESGWCPTKLQGHYGGCPAYAPAAIPSGIGYGLGQATPGYKMASFGSDWQVNAVTQLRWASSYAKSSHGSWAGAYSFWQRNTWW